MEEHFIFFFFFTECNFSEFKFPVTVIPIQILVQLPVGVANSIQISSIFYHPDEYMCIIIEKITYDCHSVKLIWL